MRIAVSIVHKSRKAPNLVRKPRPTRTPPTSWASAAAPSQSHVGRMNEKREVRSVKALKHCPPNDPSTICEPCAMKTAAQASRMGSGPQLAEVARVLRSIIEKTLGVVVEERRNSNRGNG